MAAIKELQDHKISSFFNKNKINKKGCKSVRPKRK
jgi:hypothetical protein